MKGDPRASSSLAIPGFRARPTLAILLAAVAAGYGFCLTRLPLIRAEAMYALIPREMLASGDWLTPTLQGVPYFDKPPLLYWLNALIFGGLGIGEATCRLVNLPLALLTVWLTWRLGRELIPERAALLGAGVLAGSLGFFILHLQLLPDHLITLWLLLALWCWRCGLAAPTRLTEWGFSVCLAGGFFSKGLIGFVFPLGIVALTSLAAGRREGLRHIRSPSGWLPAVLPVAGWLLLLEHRHPGFLWHFLINEQVLRFLGARKPLDIQSFSLPGFWLLTLLWLMPWTPLLPAAVAQTWRAAASTGPHRLGASLLLLWPAVILGFYSLSGCRVEYYPLPALPALALLVGWRLERGLALPQDRLLTATLLFLTGLALLAGLAVPSLEALLSANRREFGGLTTALAPLLPWGTLPLAILALTGALAGRCLPWAALSSLAGVALGLLTVSFLSLKALSPFLSDSLPGNWLRHWARPDDAVIMDTVEEYEYAASLVWYAGVRVHLVVREGLPRFPRPVPPEESYLLTPEDLEALWHSPLRVWVLVDIGAPPRKPWQESGAVATFPGRHLYGNKASGDGCRGEGKRLSSKQFSTARPAPGETAGGSPPGAAMPGQPPSE